MRCGSGAEHFVVFRIIHVTLPVCLWLPPRGTISNHFFLTIDYSHTDIGVWVLEYTETCHIAFFHMGYVQVDGTVSICRG